MIKVGVGILIFNKKHELLLMQRKNKHGSDSWAPPGGKLELGETWLQCAQREAMEEVNITINDIAIVGITNDIFDAQTHYITIHAQAITFSGNPVNKEPEKCNNLGWFALNQLPSPLFLPFENLLSQIPISFVPPKTHECHK